MPSRIDIPEEKVEDFCRRWKIKEMAIFGSALREDFGPESDVDFLVTFFEQARWSLFDWAEMIEELKKITGREIDLVERESIRNPFRRRSILARMEVIYGA
ncbi:MAG TPA: nucleotidyltransferase domain-containing protein [Methanothrix soehngenii]|nr:nucleotidyltransferase domain-containing protein [Methanothrix soehngenii]